jgi:hypothetical protein
MRRTFKVKCIYKYTCPPAVYDWVAQVHQGAEILGIDKQGGAYVFWALVEANALPVPRRFKLIATGQPFEDMPNAKYCGTINEFLVVNYFVLHLFDLGEVPNGDS